MGGEAATVGVGWGDEMSGWSEGPYLAGDGRRAPRLPSGVCCGLLGPGPGPIIWHAQGGQRKTISSAFFWNLVKEGSQNGCGGRRRGCRWGCGVMAVAVTGIAGSPLGLGPEFIVGYVQGCACQGL